MMTMSVSKGLGESLGAAAAEEDEESLRHRDDGSLGAGAEKCSA
jgi:hypothetical protein